MMTKKDFELIAAALRDTTLINCPTAEYLAGVRAAHVSAATRLADALATTNPKFDRVRFLAACGVK